MYRGTYIDAMGRQRAPRPEFLFIRQFQQLYDRKSVQFDKRFSPEIT